MLLGRFKFEKEIFYGIVKDKTVFKIDYLPFNDNEIKITNEKYNLNELKILPPSSPTKIIAVGLNYKDHAKELGFSIPDEPVIFMKPSSAIIGPDDKIIIPPQTQRVDYEAELAFIIKKECYKKTKEEFRKYVLGYTCFNDVTARDLQKKDGQWTRAKSFNTFAPAGPFIFIPETSDFNPLNLKIKAIVNGEVKQNSSTANMIFSPPYLFEFINNIMTLYPGDIIATGTPPGIGPLRPGDEVSIEIESIGKLTNKVAASE